MSTSFAKGISAEQKVVQFLLHHGYTILCQRYRTPEGEIDIIAKKGNVFHMIEVKHRPTLSEAREAISPRQRQRINAAAQVFLATTDQDDFDVQMDAVFVVDNSIVLLEKAWSVDE